MADEMKTLKVEAENGSFSFDIVDQTARDAAKEAKDAVEKFSIPKSLPNPHKLTFSGGATGEYDGSAAVEIVIPTGGDGGSGPIQYVESMDTNNYVYLRDLASGVYILYGYFRPYSGAPSRLVFDNILVSVAADSTGSHILAFSTVNSKIDFFSIEVDSTQTSGFAYNRTTLSLLELNALLQKETLPMPETAEVGQFIKISAVDANGKVTATEAVTIERAEGVGF